MEGESARRLRRGWKWLRRATSNDLFLEDGVLVQRSGLWEVRLPLREVRQVRSDWIPYGGRVLHVSGGGRRITFRFDEGTVDLRHKIGSEVVKNGPSVVESASVRRDLGLS